MASIALLRLAPRQALGSRGGRQVAARLYGRAAAVIPDSDLTGKGVVPVSDLEVPLVPEPLAKTLFGKIGHPRAEQIRRAKEHLLDHNLLLKTTVPPQTERLFAKLRAPELLGTNVEQHFVAVTRQLAKPYKGHALALAGAELPRRPAVWDTSRAGWVKYEGDKAVAVQGVDADAVVFDVETCLHRTADGSVNKYPTLAVAASPTAWYSWCSHHVLSDTDPARTVQDGELIAFGDPARKRLVVGHNVSYDRARILEEYGLQGTNTGFLDTMSLHMCLAGMSSVQRNVWQKHMKARQTGEPPSDGKAEPKWLDNTAMNSLADLHTLYCKAPRLSKARRDYFVQGDLAAVRANLHELIDYCASDVAATHEVYRVVAPKWFDAFKSDVTFVGMMEMSRAYLPINPHWGDFVQGADALFAAKMQEIADMLATLADDAVARWQADPHDVARDPWLQHLDWSLPRGKLRGPHADVLQDKPKWYRDAHKLGALSITTRSRTAPYLLRLSWNGRPLVFNTKQHSWGYVDEEGEFFKLPHADGGGKSVGNPLAKGFLKDVESGTLRSGAAEGAGMDAARKALETAIECSYWVSTQDRVKQQLVHREPGCETPVVIPQLICAGTVTRRAVEATWLTASNAKANRLGSELKAQVQAPDGYKLVGADVDSQELWIAALFGDAAFAGIHGATAMGWMALRGTKSEGTDVHSRTAQLVGIDRNTAKIFNYGRIYGAGEKFAAKLLMHHNRSMTPEEAEAKAKHLYANTKGLRWYKLKDGKAAAITHAIGEDAVVDGATTIDKLKQYAPSVKSLRQFYHGYEWRGGTESHMFNALEAKANEKVPRTPVLGCPLSEVLRRDKAKDEFLTSRINWVVQSSAVDYLHLMLVSMRYFCNRYKIDAKFCISIHDEVRYLVRAEDVERAALALHYTNLLVRAMFAHKLGVHSLPASVAFFEAVDVDTVLRKEVDMDCVTPSQPQAIPHGKILTMAALVEDDVKLAPSKRARSRPTLLHAWEPFDTAPPPPPTKVTESGVSGGGSHDSDAPSKAKKTKGAATGKGDSKKRVRGKKSEVRGGWMAKLDEHQPMLPA